MAGSTSSSYFEFKYTGQASTEPGFRFDSKNWFLMDCSSNYKEISLTQGKVALVDEEDFEWLSQFKWRAHKATRGQDLFYAWTSIWIEGKNKTFQMHRLVMRAIKGDFIDHINHNGLDNRKENLRFCTKSQNNMNARKQNNCHSVYKGVTLEKSVNRWKAFIYFNKKRIHLGYFDSQEVAALAYNDKAKEYFGEFACLNEL